MAAGLVAGAAWNQPGISQQPPDLKKIAAAHVQLAERTRKPSTFWGRMGGSVAEIESARLCADQLRPYMRRVSTEPFEFEAHRMATWTLAVDRSPLASAMPAPFDARFPEQVVEAPLSVTKSDDDWTPHRGKWIFASGEQGRAVANSVVREKLLYQKAVAAGAVGFAFSIATPQDDTWQSVVPVDKAYAVKDTRYPDGRRPIPCFCVDTRDGNRLAVGGALRGQIVPAPQNRHKAENTVGFLPGAQRRGIAILCHLDSFFSGACDNATGIATMVGLAARLSALPLNSRLADFHFLGLAAHHDAGAGMRAFLEKSAVREAAITEMLLLEHTDALDLPAARRAGWALPLNDQRTAYLGSQGWPEVAEALPALVKASGVMRRPPSVQNACIADLFVNCGKVKAFCLMNSPPIYHTNHDTLEWISGAGIARSVDFHLRLLVELGAISY